MADEQDAVKIAGEWTKQLGLWASGTIVLSLTFLKDFLKGAPVSTFWRWWLVGTWLLLIGSLFFGHLAFGAPLTGAGKSAHWKLQVNQQTRTLSIAQLSLFLLGLVGMVIFASYHLAGGAEPNPAPASQPFWQPVGCVGPFVTGSADHLEARDAAAGDCGAPRQIAETLQHFCGAPAECSIVLVGSADKAPLRGLLEQDFGGNEGLARARAEWVLDQLSAATGARRAKFLVLTAGPSAHGAGIADIDLRRDRSVAVLAVKSAPAKPMSGSSDPR